jgi:hypothetical protein
MWPKAQVPACQYNLPAVHCLVSSLEVTRHLRRDGWLKPTRPMSYVAYTSREGRHHLAEFPDAPGCQTFAASGLTVSFGTLAEPTASWPARTDTGTTHGRR